MREVRFFTLENFVRRLFEAPEIETLIRERQLGPLQGFRSKMGRPFAAVIKLNAENKAEFDSARTCVTVTALSRFQRATAGRKCPKCGSNVFETAMHYICEKATGPNRTCDFRSGKLILQQPIERAQMEKFLSTAD